MPLASPIPKPDDSHITADKEMPLLLLPSCKNTGAVSDGVEVGNCPEGRSELGIALGLITAPNADAAFA